MNYLNCYSLNSNKVTKGIKVSHYESVIPTKVNTDTIYKATLQTVPIFSGTNSFHAKYLGIPFVHQAAPKDTCCSTGILLSVKASLWTVCSDKSEIVIVDPCGLQGHILLYITNNIKDCLVSLLSDDVISIEDNEPVISKSNRARLLLAALCK